MRGIGIRDLHAPVFRSREVRAGLACPDGTPDATLIDIAGKTRNHLVTVIRMLHVRETDLDLIFQALANTTRRQIMDVVAAAPGSSVNQVAEHFEMSRVGVLKHINLLEQAGLLISERVGRERPLQVNLVPLQLIQERWSDRYRNFWASRLTRLKYAVEGSTQE